jgi:hypothetical protein
VFPVLGTRVCATCIPEEQQREAVRLVSFLTHHFTFNSSSHTRRSRLGLVLSEYESDSDELWTCAGRERCTKKEKQHSLPSIVHCTRHCFCPSFPSRVSCSFSNATITTLAKRDFNPSPFNALVSAYASHPICFASAMPSSVVTAPRPLLSCSLCSVLGSSRKSFLVATKIHLAFGHEPLAL